MALGMVSAGIGIASSLFGGGGPRAPRMNCAQKQAMMAQANLQNALAQRIRGGCQGVGQCNRSMCGNRCGHNRCGGPISNCGMNGANQCGGGCQGGPVRALANLLRNIVGGGGNCCGPNFGPPPFHGPGAHVSVGINMHV